MASWVPPTAAEDLARARLERAEFADEAAGVGQDGYRNHLYFEYLARCDREIRRLEANAAKEAGGWS